ncbi:MAG TPA: hypothetical protein VII61_00955 [Ktedonobacteraceae bacterium]
MGARSAALADAKPNPFRGSVLNGNAQNPTAFAGNVFLDNDIDRYFLLSTGLTLVHLVNSEVVELQTGKASEGTFLNTCRYRSPIAFGKKALAGSGQVGLQRRRADATPSLQAPALSGVGFLTMQCPQTN